MFHPFSVVPIGLFRVYGARTNELRPGSRQPNGCRRSLLHNVGEDEDTTLLQEQSRIRTFETQHGSHVADRRADRLHKQSARPPTTLLIQVR